MTSAQLSIIKYKIEALADTSLKSCFSEYCIRLNDDYDLLYVDTAYKVSCGGLDSFNEHLAGYIDENLSTDCNSFYKVSYVDTDIKNTVFADDDGYTSLEGQIMDYVRDKGIHASKDRALNYYIFDKLSYRNNCKDYSVHEYEIEYVITGSYEELSEDDDISELLSEMDYDVKLKRLAKVIEVNMRENYSEYFEFDNLLESAEVTFYMKGLDKTYEITKEYSFAE